MVSQAYYQWFLLGQVFSTVLWNVVTIMDKNYNDNNSLSTEEYLCFQKIHHENSSCAADAVRSLAVKIFTPQELNDCSVLGVHTVRSKTKRVALPEAKRKRAVQCKFFMISEHKVFLDVIHQGCHASYKLLHFENAATKPYNILQNCNFLPIPPPFSYILSYTSSSFWGSCFDFRRR